MDFSTRLLQYPPATPDLRQHWAHLAISAMVSASPESFICQTKSDSPANAMNCKANPARWWPGGLMNHPYPEICIPIVGRAVIGMDNKQYKLSPSTVAIVEPDTSHCEGYARTNASYTLLWLSLSGPANMVIISQYFPEHGWTCPARWAFSSASVQKLSGRFTTPLAQRIPRQWAELVRADLLAVLAELHRTCVYEAVGPQEDNKQQYKHASLLKQVRTFIENHLDATLALPDLASSTGMTPNYLNTLHRKWCGESIHSYVVRRRMETALELCRHGNMLIKQIAMKVGYKDQLYFSRAFRKFHGVWPTQATPK